MPYNNKSPKNKRDLQECIAMELSNYEFDGVMDSKEPIIDRLVDNEEEYIVNELIRLNIESDINEANLALNNIADDEDEKKIKREEAREKSFNDGGYEDMFDEREAEIHKIEIPCKDKDVDDYFAQLDKKADKECKAYLLEQNSEENLKVFAEFLKQFEDKRLKPLPEKEKAGYEESFISAYDHYKSRGLQKYVNDRKYEFRDNMKNYKRW